MSETINEGTTDTDDWGSPEAQPSPIPGATVTPDLAATPQKSPPPVFQELSSSNPNTHSNVNDDLDMILDIPVQITVELGRTRIAIKNLLQLAQGSVIELDGMAGEPMDVLVNGCLIAQGEVVVVNERFGVRLTDIITPSERIRKLNR